MDQIIDFLVKPYLDYTTLQITLEVIAALLGVASVICSARKSIWVYPTGIVSTAIYVYLLFGWGLYGDMIINAYYFVMSIYGWYLWSRVDENAQHIPVSIMKRRERWISVAIFVSAIVAILIVYHFKPYIESGFNSEMLAQPPAPFAWMSDGDLPFDQRIQYVDTLTTAMFFVGMWLMSRKKLENWIFWILGDVIAVPMYLMRGYGVTAGQYLIFLIPAVIGYYNWRKDLRQQRVLKS